jgi:hypothetical protein
MSIQNITKIDALNVMSLNDITPEQLLNTLLYTKQSHRFLKDNDTTWLFILRRRCHVYLMAKHPLMEGYIEIMKKNS